MTGTGILTAPARQLRGAIAARPGAWLGAALLTLPMGVLYYDTFFRLLGDWWKDPNHSHGVLIPPVALYFAWQKRGRLRSLPVEPRGAAGLALVLVGLAVYFVGRLGAEFFLTRFSFIPLVGGLILYFRGREHLKTLAFPLCFLALAIPIPLLVFNTISLPLQALASHWSSELLQLCSIPVLREGNVIYMANASLGVAEACSGLRSLVSLVALSVILAYLRWSGWRQRVLLVALSAPLALLLNILRITGTGLIANHWDVEYAMGFFHAFSGWIVFVLAFTILLGASALIQRWLPSPPPQQESA